MKNTRSRKPSTQTLTVISILMGDMPGWHYGYDLSKQSGLKSGSLYPILMRLCDRGWLEARWETSSEPGRPPRHLYRLTRTGLLAATEALAKNRVHNFSGEPAWGAS